MIIPTVGAYYFMNLSTVLSAEVLDSICEAVAGDITSITVVSKVKESDIESIHDLEVTTTNLQKIFSAPVIETIDYNPLYFPMGDEAVLDALGTTSGSAQVEFYAVDKNPYTVMTRELSFNDTAIATGAVRFREFNLPSYEEIITANKKVLN